MTTGDTGDKALGTGRPTGGHQERGALSLERGSRVVLVPRSKTEAPGIIPGDC